MIRIWSSRCHCHPITSCFIKIRNGWCQLTQVVLEKRLLNRCLSVCLSRVVMLDVSELDRVLSSNQERLQHLSVVIIHNEYK